jgi:hypothetical protein
MTLDEKYQKISLMIDNGTGVLFQPMSNEYTYILTAKHNLQFKNKDNIYVDKNIEEIVLKDDSGTVLELKIEGMYHHQDLDISILKINYYEVEYFINFLTNRESDRINFNFYGYPSTRRNQDIKGRLVKLEYNNQPNTELIVMKNTESSSQSEIVGFSGGGVFFVENEELYLLGIERKMDDESTREESNTSVNITPILKFFEIVDFYGNDELPLLLPPYLDSFANFLDESFPLDNMIFNKNDVQSVLRQCIREKIKVLPSDFLTRNTINVIKSNINDNVNNKTLWIMYLEFLVFCKIVKEYEFNITSIEEVLSDFKFVFGKSKEWTQLIPDVFKSDLSSLLSGGTIFVGCDGDCNPRRTEILTDSLINIDRRPNREEMNIDEGITNPFKELKVKHIRDIQGKIVDNENLFNGLTDFDSEEIERIIRNAVI